MQSVLWILLWWAIVGFIGWAVFAFIRFLGAPRYRDFRSGDVSTEVGYEVDAYGVRKHADEDTIFPGMPRAEGDEDIAQPHATP